MAKVRGPFFSTFATGSIGNKLTVSACYSGNKFVMGMKKTRAGKRSDAQKLVSSKFAERNKGIYDIMHREL